MGSVHQVDKGALPSFDDMPFIFWTPKYLLHVFCGDFFACGCFLVVVFDVFMEGVGFFTSFNFEEEDDIEVVRFLKTSLPILTRSIVTSSRTFSSLGAEQQSPSA